MLWKPGCHLPVRHATVSRDSTRNPCHAHCARHDDPAGRGGTGARYEAVRLASSLTHAHPLACTCCFVFEEYLRLLSLGWGRDADTTASVAGAAAALCWGRDSIPEEWVEGLAGRDELLRIARKAAAQIKAGAQAG